jgi:hypothetical protein
MSSTRQKFFENYYLKVPGFIPDSRAAALARAVEEDEALGPDRQQVIGADITYNTIPLLELLCEKTPAVTRLIGEPVLPTYVFARVYKRGASLVRHSDRPACEISLSLNLSRTHPWPLWIQSPDGPASVDLEPGEAMLYFGAIDHWREQFRGTKVVQTFLHYVRSRGPNAPHYFDRINSK